MCTIRPEELQIEFNNTDNVPSARIAIWRRYLIFKKFHALLAIIFLQMVDALF